jgi:formate hydrogenlyase transcriptional activator
VETRQAVRLSIDELPEDSDRARFVRAGFKCLAYIPVLGRDRVLAVIAFASRNPSGLGALDLNLASRAAQQFGLALENAQAHAQNLRLAEKEHTLLELANAMTLHRKPQDILSEMLPALEKLVRFDRTDVVTLFETDAGSLNPLATTLPLLSESEYWNPRILEPGPTEQSLVQGQSLRLPASEEWHPLVRPLGKLGFSVSLLVPLTVHSRLVGVCWLVSRRAGAFQGADMETLSRVAQQFGLALEAARGYVEIERRERRLAQENQYLKQELSGVGGFEEMVGVSRGLARVRELVKKVALTDEVVLIRGESGTGKELVAEALHRLSRREDQPLIRVNCASLAESIISSELFGHEKGAFTGAVSQRLGRFEVARGGTLFLDEIAELSPEVQAKLLRVIQYGEFERVGSSVTLKTDARIVAATNRDLERAVAQGRFREDLFYRLNVFPIHIPPLRERREDIPVLLEYFLHRGARKLGKDISHIEPESEKALVAYDWPGNVRELQNTILRAVLLCEGDVLRLEPDSEGMSREPRRGPGYSDTAVPSAANFREAERGAILTALRKAGGRIAGPEGAAALLGLKRTTLHSKMKKLEIHRTEYLYLASDRGV